MSMTMPEILERVLKLSQADDAVVIGQDFSSVNVRWANNTTTTNGLIHSRELYVISIKDKRVGVAGRNSFEESDLAGLVRESEAACANQPPADDYMPLIKGKQDQTDPAAWQAPFAPTGVSVFDVMATDLGAVLRQAEGEGVKLFGYAEHSSYAMYLATSTGVRRRHDQRKGQFEINAKSADFKRSVWAGQATADFRDVDIKQIYDGLVQKLDWAKTRVDLPAGRYETLLEPSAVADLLIYAYWSSSARDADEGHSVYSMPGGQNKIGQQLFPKSVTLYSDPDEASAGVSPFEVALGSSSYSSVFDNGLPLARTTWVEAGKLQNLITPRFWAAKTKREATPFVENLIFPSQGADLDEMIRRTKRGLLVTCLWYIREVDPQQLLLTGLTRDGVFLIEDGAVKGAVNNFRFNMSPIAMLAQATEIGQSRPTLAREFGDYFTFAKMPPLRIKDFNMSSVSQAV
jgi:predicted Zn-dependent protease